MLLIEAVVHRKLKVSDHLILSRRFIPFHGSVFGWMMGGIGAYCILNSYFAAGGDSSTQKANRKARYTDQMRRHSDSMISVSSERQGRGKAPNEP